MCGNLLLIQVYQVDLPQQVSACVPLRAFPPHHVEQHRRPHCAQSETKQAIYRKDQLCQEYGHSLEFLDARHCLPVATSR